ncbi:TniQ family protein [Nostoc sp. FACHB-152]|uniref:TniQ family protein n=1 Tax=unclassified Nostoc TaxID=2593658 RepID=UPI00168617F4|nr:MULTISPECIES: TniQ family protein [unclassified Nostoc]MBD2447389.1 TniQ family protein [Nostoc sp. FACHB-152]MBD2468199.1 TniQ family protein [Nostoc sp. FACHB-145]
MQPKGLIKYKFCEFKKSVIPLRSYLYSLEPIGIGTPLVESLTGYVARLAEVHCVVPGILMERELAPVVNKAYGGANLHKIYTFTRAFNGTGVMADDLIQALQSLTLRDDLKLLTMINWSEIFPFINLLRSVKAWCPICYQEWYETEKQVYEPLLWSLDVVKVCPHHQQYLSEKCHYCHKGNSLLAWKSRPGYCSKCGQWLGYRENAEFVNKQDIANQEFKLPLWAANNVGDLLAAGSHLNFVPLKNQVAASLRNYADYVSQGNIAEFARYLHQPRNTVWLWCQGKNQPSLDALVRTCYYFQVSLLSFLNQEELLLEQFQKTTSCLTKLSAKPRATPKPFESAKVQEYLENVLQNNEFPPPSMEEVARRLDCDRRTVYNHFKDLCNAISAKYLSYRRTNYVETVAQSCQKVREAALKLYENGEYPSEARVSELISKPGFLRYKQVRAALRETRRDLGLDS